MKIRTLYIDNEPVKSMSIDGKAVAFTAAAAGYLCFTAEEAGSTVQLEQVGSPNPVLLQTSTNAKQWNNYIIGDDITLTNVGDKVYFKATGVNTAFSSSTSNYYMFVMTGLIAASGNVNSLLNENYEEVTNIPNFCYYDLFADCTSLTQTPKLPATTLANHCYRNMFNGCTSLTQAPELPATSLATNCYTNMFYGCTSLIKAPELKATILARNCYQYMFYGCNSLSSIKVAFTAWDPSNATGNWLPETAGTFTCPWELITNTTTRSTSTVPASWTMVAEV